MRKGAHRWGAADPVDMFNELNWFMGMAYILSTVSLSHTFTYSQMYNCVLFDLSGRKYIHLKTSNVIATIYHL